MKVHKCNFYGVMIFFFFFEWELSGIEQVRLLVLLLEWVQDFVWIVKIFKRDVGGLYGCIYWPLKVTQFIWKFSLEWISRFICFIVENEYWKVHQIIQVDKDISFLLKWEHKVVGIYPFEIEMQGFALIFGNKWSGVLWRRKKILWIKSSFFQFIIER